MDPNPAAKIHKKREYFITFVKVRKEMSDYIDLFTLQSMTKEGIEDLFPDSLWVKAEVSAVNVKTNGHCYLELSQSNDKGLIARTKAVIWRSKYSLLSHYFTSVTGSPLKAGINVLVSVRLSFHEIYGLTLVIDDIDAEFTLGEREQQKRMTIDRLTGEGLMDLQKRLALPELPYYLAVISAQDAAGYGDFRRHLLENEYGFAYQTDLFEATMQGSGAPASIIAAMDRISASKIPYDAVLILRGGGSELDLACFDDYSLAAAIARFPVPVYTAIGHDRDNHVADMVACGYVKTPTALADLFLESTIAEDERISSFDSRLRLAFSNRLNMLSNRLEWFGTMVTKAVDRRLERAESQLRLFETRIDATDPRNVLKRGFSLILDERGVRFVSARGKKKGDRLTVLMPDGKLGCTVDNVDETKE